MDRVVAYTDFGRSEFERAFRRLREQQPHTACAELWRGRAELIPPARSYVPEFSVLEMGEVSPQGVARALESLYRDPARRRQLARAAVAVAHNPAHSWDVITRQFDDLITTLAKGTSGCARVRLRG